MVCACFTWGLILYAEFVVLRVILLPEVISRPSPYNIFNLVLFQGLAVLAVSSHLRTMLTDPVRLALKIFQIRLTTTRMSYLLRAQCPGATLPKKILSGWDSKRDRSSSNAPSAAASSPSARTTVRSVSGASARWTTTVPGSTTVWEREIRNSSYYLR